MAAKNKSRIEDRTIFALDIGTRSIIGIVGIVEDERLKVIALEREEHTRRAMIDGQIEDIEQVARLASAVKKRLESKLGFPLTKVCIAAAGRALLTQKGTYELEFPETVRITPEIISRLESGAISQAEEAFSAEEESCFERPFFLVGYSVLTYSLDNYNFSTILDHKGRHLKADIIATFLPSQVVESLYAAMNKIDLEVVSLTLEPIAAINASIPRDLRLLNLAMVDIGAGTSDIAVCRDGGITGYTMAILAGDELTEALMKQYLVDFKTAEKLKFGLSDQEELVFNDILGFEQKVKREEVLECVREPLQAICSEIARQIVDLNNGAPSAVFLAGGGSKMVGLKECITENLGMDGKRVAIVGNNFALSAFSDEYDLNNPEYATPLGIAVSAGLNLINDSFQVTLNGKPAKLFKSGVFTIMDVLMMNGYGYKHLVSRSGRNIVVQINGKRLVIPGAPSVPAVLKLNGNDCSMTELIHAGDTIEFQPAVCGRDASAAVSDVLKPGFKNVTVNGRKASPGTQLHTGDVIVAEDLLEERNASGKAAGSPVKESLTAANHAGPGIHDVDFAEEEAAAGLAEESVAAAGLAEENVTAAGLAGENVTPTGLAEESVAAAGLAGENVTAAGLAGESVTAAGLAGESVTAADLAGESITPTGLAGESVAAAAGSAAENLEADVYSKKGGKTAGKNISPQGFTGQYTMIAEGSAGEENIMSVRPSGASHGNTGNFSKYGDSSKNSPEIIRTEKAASEPEPEGSFYILDEQHFPEDHIPGKGQKNAAVPKLLRIILNDAPLTLEKKPDGTAYMLMDILERSGLDFEHLSGPVTITVNGKNAAFLQRLFEGDIVVIRSE